MWEKSISVFQNQHAELKHVPKQGSIGPLGENFHLNELIFF